MIMATTALVDFSVNAQRNHMIAASDCPACKLSALDDFHLRTVQVTALRGHWLALLAGKRNAVRCFSGGIPEKRDGRESADPRNEEGLQRRALSGWGPGVSAERYSYSTPQVWSSDVKRPLPRT
jgi:hypothetical protein